MAMAAGLGLPNGTPARAWGATGATPASLPDVDFKQSDRSGGSECVELFQLLAKSPLLGKCCEFSKVLVGTFCDGFVVLSQLALFSQCPEIQQ